MVSFWYLVHMIQTCKLEQTIHKLDSTQVQSIKKQVMFNPSQILKLLFWFPLFRSVNKFHTHQDILLWMSIFNYSTFKSASNILIIMDNYKSSLKNIFSNSKFYQKIIITTFKIMNSQTINTWSFIIQSINYA